MRSVFLAVSTAVAFLLPASAWAQISLVQVTSCGPSPFPGTSCTIPATGSGHLIVVGWQSAANSNFAATIGSVTDNAGNTYVEAGAARSVDAAETDWNDIWYAKNSAAGATSVVITPSASIALASVVIWEFSGVDGAAPLDQIATLNSQASTTTPSGASVTITQPNEVVITLADVATTVTGIVAGNPFVNDSSLFTNGWAHYITSSAGTYSAQWNQSPPGTYGSSTVSFIAAGSFSACDLNQDGSVNILDVQLAANMVDSSPPCTAPSGWCTDNYYTALVNAALPGGACLLPVLSAPATVGFGNVIVGNPSTQTVTLSGAGTGSTTISQATVSGTGFSLSGPSLPLTLALGQSANFTVTFTPLAAGNFAGGITFVSNPPNGAINSPVTETLTGAGVNAHYVSLTWQASTSQNVAGYNVFRASSSSGPFNTPLNSSLVTTTCGALFCYTDSNVVAGQTYYYVATAVNSSNNQSADSSPPVQATIPSP